MDMRSNGSPARVLMFCSVLQLSGCSVIGFTAGAIKDASLPEEYVITRDEIGGLEHGIAVIITRIDSTVFVGEFSSCVTLRSKEYADAYKEHMDRHPLRTLLPKLGDSIRIVVDSTQKQRESFGRLVGFGCGAISLRASGETEVTNIPIKTIDSLSGSSGEGMDGVTLRRHLTNGDIPLMETGMLVEVGGQTTAVPIDSILEIHYPTSRNEKWWNLGIGLALDAVCVTVAAAIIREIRENEHRTPWPFRW